MESKLIFYSTNEEDYNCSDADEAVEMAIDNLDEAPKVGDVITVYEGEADKTKAGDWISAGCVVDKITDWHYEDCGENDWHHIIKPEHTQALQPILEKAINEWATKFNIHPTYHKVKNVKELIYKITQSGGEDAGSYKWEKQNQQGGEGGNN